MDSYATNARSLTDLSNGFLTPTIAYIFLAIFSIIFFIGLVFLYFRRHFSSTDFESGDIHGQPALNSVASRSLTVVTVVAETAGECAICLEEVVEGSAAKMIAYCNHIFHADCIERWLEKQVTCPVCRYSERSGEVELLTVGGGEEEYTE